MLGENVVVSHKLVVVLIVLTFLFTTIGIVAELQSGIFASPKPPLQIYDPAIPAATEKVVCIVFDDGWKSQLDAVPVLDRYNFTATFAIVTSYCTYPDYMTWKDIAKIAAKGNDIVSHTVSHPRLSQLDNETLHAELANSRHALRDKGYAADVLVYPYGDGDTTQTVQDAVSKYYLIARGTETGKHNITSSDRFTINSYGIYNDTTIDDFIEYLDGTGGNNITIFYYHKISPENVDTAIPIETFQTQMQYLHEQGYSVRTISELFLKQVHDSD